MSSFSPSQEKVSPVPFSNTPSVGFSWQVTNNGKTLPDIPNTWLVVFAIILLVPLLRSLAKLALVKSLTELVKSIKS